MPMKGYRPCRADYHGDGAFDAAQVTPIGDVTRSDGRTIISRALTLAPFDQQHLGSCEANAAVGGLMICLPDSPPLARLDLYVKCLFHDATFPSDLGTSGETVHDILRTVGVCREDLHPYTDADWQHRPSVEALQDGYHHRLDATHRIVSAGDQRVADLKASIDAGRPVQIGGDVSQAYEDYSGDDAPKAWHAFSPSVGGHAQLIVGYWDTPKGETLFLVRNSWGADWGLTEFPGHAWYARGAIDLLDELFSYYVAQ